MLMNMSISSLVVLGIPTTLIIDLIVFVLPYFVAHVSIALFLYGTIFRWIFVKPKLYPPSKTVYLTTSLTNVSLNLTPLEFKHGKHLNNKLAKNVGIIYSLRHYLGFHMLKQLYYTLIKFYPYLNYGLASWGAAYKTRLQKICTKQNRCSTKNVRC